MPLDEQHADRASLVGIRMRPLDASISLLDLLESVAAMSDEEMRTALDDASARGLQEIGMFLCTMREWAQVGRPRYVLGESVAAMLIATRSAPFEAAAFRVPFPAFVVQVPAAFSPWASSAALYILVGTFRDDQGLYIDITARQVGGGEASGLILAEREGKIGEQLFEDASKRPESLPMPLARLVMNLIWYLTAHRECVVREHAPPRPGATRAAIHRVGLPRDLVVTRELRQHARELAKATTLRGVRAVLRHMVCGHWKRPPRGDGSRLIWIAPYARGDLALGRVVAHELRVSEVRA